MEQKALNFVLKLWALVLSLLYKAFAICTEPFFRRKPGERYFTGPWFLLSLFLWYMVFSESESYRNLSAYPAINLIYKMGFKQLAFWLSGHHLAKWVCFIIILSYFLLGLINFAGAFQRRREGTAWHSRSCGESVFGSENPSRDCIVALLVSLVLALFAPLAALLFFISQGFSMLLRAYEAKVLYDRFLDAVDAKIEQQFMQDALEKNRPPQSTMGLSCRLPVGLNGSHRDHVARVLAGNQLPAKEEAQARRGKKQTESGIPSMGISNAVEFPSVDWGAQGEKALALFLTVLRSRRLIYLVLLVVSFVVIAEWGGSAWRSISKATRSTYAGWILPKKVMASSMPMAVTNVPSEAKGSEMPSSSNLSSVASPSSNIEAVPAAIPIQTKQTSAGPPTSATNSKTATTEFNTLEAQVAAFKGKLASMQLENNEHQIFVHSLAALIETNDYAIYCYRSNFDVRVQTNILRLNRLSVSRRSNLAAKNQESFDQMRILCNRQIATFAELRQSLNHVRGDVNSDAQDALIQAQHKFTDMEEQRKQLLDDYDKLEAEIDKATKKKGFFN